MSLKTAQYLQSLFRVPFRRRNCFCLFTYLSREINLSLNQQNCDIGGLVVIQTLPSITVCCHLSCKVFDLQGVLGWAPVLRGLWLQWCFYPSCQSKQAVRSEHRRARAACSRWAFCEPTSRAGSSAGPKEPCASQTCFGQMSSPGFLQGRMGCSRAVFCWLWGVILGPWWLALPQGSLVVFIWFSTLPPGAWPVSALLRGHKSGMLSGRYLQWGSPLREGPLVDNQRWRLGPAGVWACCFCWNGVCHYVWS